MNAPIALFVYNRLEHTRKTVESLLENEEAASTDIYIFSDHAKSESNCSKVNDVRSYISGISGFRSTNIFHREENFGLAKSIISGIGYVLTICDRVIVVEDDIVTSRKFLSYMNEALQKFEKNKNVGSIHGYVYPISEELPEFFFLKGGDCWGWATWEDRWALFEPDGKKLLDKLSFKKKIYEFDLDGSFLYSDMLRGQIDGKNDSWAVRWHASLFLEDKLTLYPGKSYVLNIGNDDSGTHCGQSDYFQVGALNDSVEIPNELKVEENLEARNAFKLFFQPKYGNIIFKIAKKVLRQFRKLR